MGALSEQELIARYFAPLAANAESFGLTDDAALLGVSAGARGFVVTTDALVAGVHFFAADAPCDIAYKALAVNVSDLAAKGARPRAYTLALGLTEAPTATWAADFASGLAQAQSAFHINLIGGDTVRAVGASFLSVTAFGEAPARGMVPRGGAKAGDVLYVSGTLGDSALGLKLRLHEEVFANLDAAARGFLLERYLRPQPRIGLIEALVAYANAAMDVSDGLALDLSRLCKAALVSAEVWVDKVPLSQATSTVLENAPDLIETVLTGGDDYEILAAVPETSASAFEALAFTAQCPVTAIGRVLPGADAPLFKTSAGQELRLKKSGFDHFA